MPRTDREQLDGLLRCVDCGAGLPPLCADGSVTCGACASAFPGLRGRPVLMRQDNALFPRSAYCDEAPGDPRRGTGFGARLKSLAPGRSINLARDRMVSRMATDLGDAAQRVLVIGCDNQAGELLAYFAAGPVQLVFCDVGPRADADLFCDAHALPFADECFDGVITTSVIEHVLAPHVVVGEIHRVLVPGGLAYSELPFLQAVHEGAYDFTRFTLGGHRLLFAGFDEVDAGLVDGPGVALVWAITEFAKALSGNRRVSSLLGIVARTAFFWLKYADLWLATKPRASDAACCTYFYGTRRSEPQSPSAIIAKYPIKRRRLI